MPRGTLAQLIHLHAKRLCAPAGTAVPDRYRNHRVMIVSNVSVPERPDDKRWKRHSVLPLMNIVLIAELDGAYPRSTSKISTCFSPIVCHQGSQLGCTLYSMLMPDSFNIAYSAKWASSKITWPARGTRAFTHTGFSTPCDRSRFVSKTNGRETTQPAHCWVAAKGTNVVHSRPVYHRHSA